MKAAETNVLALLQGEKVFIIPNFQRRYAWRQKEWEELWADLIREYAAPHDKHSQELEGHFLGSVVLHPAAGPASPLKRHLVIDGQQRLTTLIVLLAALRDVRREMDPEWNAHSYDAKYLGNPYDDRYPDRLVPTELDREPYLQTVRHSRPTGGIGQAYTFFRSQIQNAADSGSIDLERFGSSVLVHTLVVEIHTSPGDSVNNIFNTLNSKGRPLSATDLIRNELLLNLDDASATANYKNIWQPMEQRLVREDSRGNIVDGLFVTFFWAREVAVSADVTKKSLFQFFERRLRSLLSSVIPGERQSLVEGYFQEIYRDFQLFTIVIDPEADPGEEPEGLPMIGPDLRSILAQLKAWGSEPYLPIALWVLKLCSERRISESEAVNSLTVLLGYLVRRAVFGLHTNNLNRLLTPLPTTLSARVDDAGMLPSLVAQLSRASYRWPTDNEVRAGVLAQPIFLSGKLSQSLFLLTLLEGRLSGDARHVEGTRVVEHVIPRDLPDRWRRYLLAQGDDIDRAESIVHTLGNLVLTSARILPNDLEFVEKAMVIAGAELRVNEGVVASIKWGTSQVERRGAELADLLIEILPGPAGEYESAATSSFDLDVENVTTVLQTLPEGAWTSESEIAQVLGLQIPTVREIVAELGAEIVRLIRDDAGRVPAWLPSNLRSAVERQSFSERGVFFTAERIAALLVEGDSPVDEFDASRNSPTNP